MVLVSDGRSSRAMAVKHPESSAQSENLNLARDVTTNETSRIVSFNKSVVVGKLICQVKICFVFLLNLRATAPDERIDLDKRN